MKHLIVFGPPGAGKGTQAEKISQEFKFKHLSTGHVLREAIEKKDALSNKIISIMNQGALVSDEIVNQIIKNQTQQMGQTKFVFDGYPRTLSQAQYLDTLIEPESVYLINLVVSQSEIISRLKLRNRNDDEEENIKRRLQVYHHHTDPILNYYKETKRLYKVNGEGSIEEVFERLKKLITN